MSVFVAPLVQRPVGTVPAILGTLALFALDLAVMAVFADHAAVVIAGIVLSGAFIGNNNTLITEAVMGAAPVERPVASAAYSFVRFCGGAVGPYVALKLFGAAARRARARAVLVRRGDGRRRRGDPGRRLAPADPHTRGSQEETAVDEAEAILVGDLD